MNSLYGSYRQLKFSEVFDSFDTFNTDKESIPIPIDLSDDDIRTLYYLLYSRYGNSVVASSDINRFKFDLFSIIYSYGPTWAKKVSLQSKLRSLTEEDLVKGGSAIYNSANNPSTSPSTDTLDELPYINNQNTTKYKKSKVEAISLQYSLLEDTVTEDFLRKFKRLFLTVVQPEKPLFYATEI